MMEYTSGFAFVVVCLLLVGGVATTSTVATGQSQQADILTANLTSTDGLTIDVRIDTDNFTTQTRFHNPTSRQEDTGLVLRFDRQGRHSIDADLAPGETVTREVEFAESIDPFRDTHTVSLSTFGNATSLSFHHDVNLSAPEQVPIPQITNVTVANDTIEGDPSTVAYVTVTNPTNQLYSMKLMVHSLETGGGWYPASVNRSDSRTIKAVLFEDRGTRVAGEARLYVNEPSNATGALDQVEFVGRAGEPTHVYNRSYEPVRGPWTDDPYQYQNESVRASETDPLPGSDRLRRIPTVAYVLGILVIVGGVLLRRRG